MLDYSLTLIEEPSTEPVTTNEIKSHLNIEHSSDDTMLAMMGKAARRYVERRCNIAIYRQRWRQVIPAFPAGNIRLHKTPVQAAAVWYQDENGLDVEVTETGKWFLDPAIGEIVLIENETWPAGYFASEWPGPVWVNFYCGYANPTSSPLVVVPEDIKIAILMLVENMYEHRGSKSEIQLYTNDTVEYLLAPYWMPL
jgi:uncharacterized phiE125 gp8 family phage protein